MNFSPNRKIIIQLPALVFSAMLPVMSSAQSFEIIDMGMEHPRASELTNVVGRSTSSGATAISDDNVVVGSIEYLQAGPTFTDQHPFITCEDCPAIILDRSWLRPVGGRHGRATSISSSGEYMVGYTGNYFDSSGTGGRHRSGIIVNQGELKSLPGLQLFINGEFFNWTRFNEAYDVNDYGDVVGSADNIAVAWLGGDIKTLVEDDRYRHSSRAYGINNHRQVVGVRDGRAVLWHDGNRHDLAMLPSHNSSTALSINNSGQTTGWSVTHGGYSRAVLWDNGTIQSLGTLPGEENSYAYDINDHGEIVGSSKQSTDIWVGFDRGPRGERPFLWQCEKMLDLNTLIPEGSGWELLEARGINDNGRIVGAGLKDGEVRAYMLKPVKGPGRGRDQGRGNGEPPVCPGSLGQGQGQGRR